MKKILKHFSLISFAFLPTGTLLVCPWQNLNENSCTYKKVTSTDQKDIAAKTGRKERDIYAHNFEKAKKSLRLRKADLDVQMKDLIYKSR